MGTAAQSNENSSDSTPPAGTFSAEERAAMKQRAAELKAEGRRGRAEDKAAAEKDAFLAKIAEMPSSDRAMAERLHAVVADAAPELLPKLYYGQPGWAKDGKVVVFFRSGLGDKERYSTLGFSSAANLDDGSGLWSTSYALDHLDDAGAAAIALLVAKAVS